MGGVLFTDSAGRQVLLNTRRVVSVSRESSHSLLVSFGNRGDALYVLPDAQEVMMQVCHDMNQLFRRASDE